MNYLALIWHVMLGQARTNKLKLLRNGIKHMLDHKIIEPSQIERSSLAIWW